MPLPKPRKNEDKDVFMKRCMSDDVMKKEFPDKDQRLAICYKQAERGGSDEAAKVSAREKLGEMR
jgi:hypothetical protein